MICNYSRRGQLKENTLEVLVTVIVFVVLFGGAGYIVYNYYFLNVAQNEDTAKGLLKVVNAKIDALDEGQESRLLVKGPCEGNEPDAACFWYLTGWGKEDGGRPQRCFFKSCVCICSSSTSATALSETSSALRDSCQAGRTGFCAFVDSPSMKVSSMQQTAVVTPLYGGSVGAMSTKLVDTEKHFISFKSNLIELKIRRSGGAVEISLVP